MSDSIACVLCQKVWALEVVARAPKFSFEYLCPDHQVEVCAFLLWSNELPW